MMARRKKKHQPPVVLRFNVGDRVRVKPGIRDNDCAEPDEQKEISSIPEEVACSSVASTLLEIAAFATSFGAVLGAAIAVIPWAGWAACVGGGVWGSVVAVISMMRPEEDLRFVLSRLHRVVQGIMGLITGAIYGALVGVMAVALIGTVLGGIVGVMLRRLLHGREWLILRIFPRGLLFASACGVVVQAFYLDSTQATEGLWYGSLIGLGSGLFFCLVILPIALLATREGGQVRFLAA